MFEHVPFKREHIVPLLDQPMNLGLRSHFLDSGLADTMEKTGVARTGLVDGIPMFCGGITDYWKDRGIVWIVFSEESKHHFVSCFRGIRKWLRELPHQRVELTTRIQGLDHRRALQWGFTLEAPRMRKFLPNGEDCALYAIVKEDQMVADGK